jgi:hypothetical protein
VKLQHIKKYLHNARSRAAREKVPFSLSLQDLIDIATDECPIFHTPFVWGISGLGKGRTRPDSPTLDRILPHLGYIKGNVAFLSYRANRIKDNGTMQEHYDIADWIWSHTHAKEIAATSVSTGDYIAGAVGAELGSVSTPWTWEDGNNTDHHSGAVQGQDADHRTEASSGDGVGRGSQEMEPSIVAQSIEATWPREPKVIWIADRGGHIPDKP